MLVTAMLLLTLNADGAVRLTLSETEDRAACTAQIAAVQDILARSGTEIRAARCIRTDLRLTPFEHGLTAAEEIHRYRVVLRADGVSVTPLERDADCAPSDGPPAVHCAVSGQRPLRGGAGP